MKNNKVLIIIVVILLNILVGFMIGQSFLGKETEYDIQLKEARAYAEKQLYRKALEHYTLAQDEEASLELYIEMIPVYEKALDNGEIGRFSDILSEIKDIVELYPNESQAYEAVCEFLMRHDEFETCAEYLMQAKDRKVASEKLTEILEQVRYTYKLKYTMYSEISSQYQNSYVAKVNEGYDLLDPELNAYTTGRSCVSSFSEGYAFIAKGDPTSEDFCSYIIDRGSVRQCYLEGVTESTGVGKGQDAEGNDLLLIAGKAGEQYHYYNMEGEKVFGDYLYAGRFRNNVAAVKQAENSWKLINAQGQPVVDKTFEDVILNEFGECAPKGLIFAKSGGKYRLYDMNGNQIGDFTCDNARPFIDTVTAFQSGTSWGFVDATGKVVIQPQYEDAKAFSGGIAGVCQSGVWSFINSEGKVVIEELMEEAGYLCNGKCTIKVNGRWAILQMYYTGE